MDGKLQKIFYFENYISCDMKEFKINCYLWKRQNGFIKIAKKYDADKFSLEEIIFIFIYRQYIRGNYAFKENYFS